MVTSELADTTNVQNGTDDVFLPAYRQREGVGLLLVQYFTDGFGGSGFRLRWQDWRRTKSNLI